jgi:protease I
MSNPPQHLLGGLNVALLVCETSDPAQVLSTRHSLEELGVNVTLVSARRGRPAASARRTSRWAR